MASNSLPKNPSQVIGLGTKMHTGLVDLGQNLGITQITAAGFQAELTQYINTYGAFNAARSARQSASDVFKPAEAAVTEWLLLTRNILAGRFGNRWSTMWAQAGFVAPSTAVPRRIEERLGLALNLANFFTANPSYEVASMQVTAARATALRNAALTAQQAVADADIELKTALDVFDVASIALTDTMRALIKILTATLNAEDPRWLAFGLQMPATNTTPGKPVNVSAHLDTTGNIVGQCDAVALATRYRWRGRLLGLEENHRLLASSTQPVAVLPAILPGQTLEIIVQAVNENLQGVASDPIVFTKPLAAAAEPLSLSVDEEAVSATGDGARSRAQAAASRR